LFSRETGLLINNVLLVAAMLSVLLGTLYPLILDTLDMGKISVGTPYFNAVFIPIMIPAVLLLAIVPFMRWKKDSVSRFTSLLKVEWIAVLVFLFVARMTIIDNYYVLLAVGIFSWIVLHASSLLTKRLRNKTRMSFSFLGMLLAHTGIGVFILGATITSQLGIEKDLKMNPGDSLLIAGYNFVFNGVNPHEKDNYRGFKGDLSVFRDNKEIVRLFPEKRYYQTGMPMTEAAIDPSLTRDLYVALGESLGSGAWSVRIYYKPMIRWVWLGGILIALGALLSVIDRRYKFKVDS